MELDNIYSEVNTGEHLHFQRGLLIKLWGFLVGENRPIDQKLKGQQRHRVLFRTRLPKQCRGPLFTFFVSFLFKTIFFFRKSNSIRTLGYQRKRIYCDP
jgi:hypothetical protein